MKKPNYKDKETGEKKIKTYLETFISENEPEAKWSENTLPYKNINVYVVEFNKLNNHTYHDLAIKYDFNEIPENFIIAFKTKDQENNLKSTFIIKTHDKVNIGLLPFIITSAVKEAIDSYLSNSGHVINGSFGIKWKNEVSFISNEQTHKSISIAKVSSVPNDTDYPSMVVLSSDVNLNQSSQQNFCNLKSLINEAEAQVSVDDFFHIYYENLIKKYQELIDAGENTEGIVNDFNEIITLKDKEVVIRKEKDNKILSKGIFEGINGNGNAILQNGSPLLEVDSGNMIESSNIQDQEDKEEDFENFNSNPTTVSIIENSKKNHVTASSLLEEKKVSEKEQPEVSEPEKDLEKKKENQINKSSKCFCRFIPHAIFFLGMAILVWYAKRR